MIRQGRRRVREREKGARSRMAARLGGGMKIDIERVVEIPSDVKEHAPARSTAQQRMRRTYNNGLSPRVASSRGEGREGGPVAEAGLFFF